MPVETDHQAAGDIDYRHPHLPGAAHQLPGGGQVLADINIPVGDVMPV